MNHEKEELKGFKTIPQMVSYLKEIDKDCAITESALRKAAKSGAIKSRKIGTRYILHVSEVYRYFMGEATNSTETDPNCISGLCPEFNRTF